MGCWKRKGGLFLIYMETWRRYQANWARLVMASVFAILLNGVVVLMGVLLMLPVLMTAGLGLGLGGGQNVLGTLLSAFTQAFLVMLLMLIAALVVGPLAEGGLWSVVVQAQRDEPGNPGDFWQGALRNWGRLLGLRLVLFVLWILVLVVGQLFRLIPYLGPLFWGIVSGVGMIGLGFYAPYLTVAEDLGTFAALAKAWRVITAKFWDLLLTILVLIGAGILLGIVWWILIHIPIIGPLLVLALEIALIPFLLLYLAVRYETNIGPTIDPPGGAGDFHPNPPSGP